MADSRTQESKLLLSTLALYQTTERERQPSLSENDNSTHLCLERRGRVDFEQRPNKKNHPCRSGSAREQVHKNKPEPSESLPYLLKTIGIIVDVGKQTSLK